MKTFKNAHLVLFFFVLASSCSSSQDNDDNEQDLLVGSEGYECYSNSKCNLGLYCELPPYFIIAEKNGISIPGSVCVKQSSYTDQDQDSFTEVEEDSSINGESDEDETVINREGTWYDENYGLIWQIEPYGTTRQEDCKSFEDSNEYCEYLTLGDYTDWRMPSISELRSLIRGCSSTVLGGFCNIEDDDCLNEQCEDSCASCELSQTPSNGCFWPDELKGDCYRYWSSSFVGGYSNYMVWTVNFEYGSVSSNGNVQYARWPVRCVRGTLFNDYEPPADGDEDPHAGTWYDPDYRLTWQTPGAYSKKWNVAINYCDELVFGGYNDWYLPTIDELRTLIRGCPNTEYGGKCDTLNYDGYCVGCEEMEDGCYLPFSTSTCSGYWSSTRQQDSNVLVWTINFSKASIMSFSEDIYVKNVMCVRKD